MEDFVPTRGSQIKRDTVNNYISMNYEAPKKTNSKDSSDNKEKRLINSKTKRDFMDLRKQQEKEMKKARYEVIKFGMSGFEKVKARRAKVELAVSLGAIPAKNRRANYKALKARRESEKKKKEEHTSGITSSMIKTKSKKIRKKDFSGILGVYGKAPKGSVVKQRS